MLGMCAELGFDIAESPADPNCADRHAADRARRDSDSLAPSLAARTSESEHDVP